MPGKLSACHADDTDTWAQSSSAGHVGLSCSLLAWKCVCDMGSVACGNMLECVHMYVCERERGREGEMMAEVDLKVQVSNQFLAFVIAKLCFSSLQKYAQPC